MGWMNGWTRLMCSQKTRLWCLFERAWCKKTWVSSPQCILRLNHDFGFITSICGRISGCRCPQIEVMKPKSWCTRTLLPPSSHSRKRRIARERTLSTYLICGSQTVQRYQHSRTCCMQCSPTHPTLVRLRVSSASSMQLTMTIRSRLMSTTFRYPCSHSLTHEHSSSRVSRWEGEGEEWVRGLEVQKLPFACMREPYS
jgi:hypothetical protein